MTDISQLRGLCPAPFLEASKFSGGGFIDGRYCMPVSEDVTCCLQCPATDWIYPPRFQTWYRVAESMNVGGFVLMALLLISYAILPVEKTRRHYLSICLVISIMMLALGFIVPLAVRPPQCFDQITPNDMYTNLTCAWSGAFLISGGLAVATWIFLRAVSMHLQICWDVMPGKKFFYSAQGFGWGIIAVLFTTTITVTGVSFRFGDACHVNSAHSIKDFWGPLLAIAGASAVVQLATFAYCINVYLKNMWSDEKDTTNSSSQPTSSIPSIRTHSPRALYRRLRKVLWLQWRSILIVVFILVDVIFFSVVFVYLDLMETASLSDPANSAIMPWITCVMTKGKDACYEVGQGALVNESTVVAILLMLSMAGFQAFFLLARTSIFTAWVDFFRDKFGRKREFVSLDARRFSSDARTFELLKVGTQSSLLRSPPPPGLKPSEGVYGTYSNAVSPISPEDTYASPISSAGRQTPDYFGKEVQRPYKSPTHSFSSPRAPSQTTMRVEWDPRSTHARGGLGFHPPDISTSPVYEYDNANKI